MEPPTALDMLFSYVPGSRDTAPAPAIVAPASCSSGMRTIIACASEGEPILAGPIAPMSCGQRGDAAELHSSIAVRLIIV